LALARRLLALERTMNQVAPAPSQEQICYVIKVLPDQPGELPGGEFHSCRIHLGYGEFCYVHVRSGVHYENERTKQWWCDWIESELYRLAGEDPQRLYDLYVDVMTHFPELLEGQR
jgi:hypothetical protein